MCTWRPGTYGTELKRLTDYQLRYQRLFYNEFILDESWWRAHLPGIIEGIFGDAQLHHAFLRFYGENHHLEESTFPLLHLDPLNWDQPFNELL